MIQIVAFGTAGIASLCIWALTVWSSQTAARFYRKERGLTPVARKAVLLGRDASDIYGDTTVSVEEFARTAPPLEALLVRARLASWLWRLQVGLAPAEAWIVASRLGDSHGQRAVDGGLAVSILLSLIAGPAIYGRRLPSEGRVGRTITFGVWLVTFTGTMALTIISDVGR